MRTVVITGSAGLIGSEAAAHFIEDGYEVVGIDNGLREHFLGPDGSTHWNRVALQTRYPKAYAHVSLDIRDADGVAELFARIGKRVALVLHTAAQPSHDWATEDPYTDFSINAGGTLVMLEATRRHAPDAVFVYTSTNKVYGAVPNELPLVELEKRFEIDPAHPYRAGIDERMRIDQSDHSLYGVSKLSADLMVQEYGRRFGLATTVFRGGCLTGPNHSGAKLHGFLAYLLKCTVTGRRYTVLGYKGKQVRDNIHSADFVAAIAEVLRAPRCGEVYNVGGTRFSNCSVLEAIEECERVAGRRLDWTYDDAHRYGDHVWYVTDMTKFKTHYPGWRQRYDLRGLLADMYAKNCERWGIGELREREAG
ncbi:MAG TPA: NAD-dependent epimerase/dehydratase family protein [Candidatus Elarobacter sp.]|jgi:CDP-paratose 2-epimerase|nr:NAD-dependent epimerase/dehydratase family protein [Candidatus Elarobacter sp.]